VDDHLRWSGEALQAKRKLLSKVGFRVPFFSFRVMTGDFQALGKDVVKAAS
jgi:hypothetical protein